MWVARFKLQDDEDLFSPLCKSLQIEFFVQPLSHYEENEYAHFVIGGLLVGSERNKIQFRKTLEQSSQVIDLEGNTDFAIVHYVRPATSGQRDELSIFFDPRFIRLSPVKASSDGWEYWEVASFSREHLNGLVQAAMRHHQCKLLSLREESAVSMHVFSAGPNLTEHQYAALRTAYESGYYAVPRKWTLPELANIKGISYATFQKHLRLAEGRVMRHFFAHQHMLPKI